MTGKRAMVMGGGAPVAELLKMCALLMTPVAVLIFSIAAAQEKADDAATIGFDPDPDPIPAQAEPDAEADDPQSAPRSALIEEIIVTAQKRAQAIEDVPIAISAYSGEALREMGVSDTRDLGNVIPGFTYADSGFNTPIYTLRGVGFNEASKTASSTVGVYLDEINLPYPVMSKGASLDLERVEVLKGPQGTLYGRNTTGGAVNYIANKPTDEFAGGLTASYGNFWTSDIEGFVTGGLREGLRLRLALRDVRSQEGWQYSLTRPEDRLGRQDKHSARGIIEWLPREDLELSLTLTGWRDRSEPQALQAIFLDKQASNPAAMLDPRVVNHPRVPEDSTDSRVADWPTFLPWQLNDSMLMGSVRGDWDIGGSTTFTALGSWGQFRSDASRVPQSGLTVPHAEIVFDVDADVAAGELRLAGTWQDSVEWLLGVYMSRDTVFELRDIYTETASTTFPTAAGPTLTDRLDLIGEQAAETQAVFAHSEWPLLDSLKLSAGVRYTDELREFAGCGRDSLNRTQGVGLWVTFNALSIRDGGTGGAMPGDCFTLDTKTHNPSLYVGRLREDNVSGRASLDWTPLDDLLVYLSYSRGFKSGSFPILPASTSAQFEPVTQEQLDAVEVGAKFTALEGRLKLNGAVFNYDYRDKQLLNRVLDPNFGPLEALANVPESRVRGAELDLRVSPLPQLVLGAAASWLDARVREFTGKNPDGEDEDFAGRRFNFTPELEYNLFAQWLHPIASGLVASAGLDYNYTSDANTDLGEDPRFAHESYSLWNARLGLGADSDAWNATVWGRNLTDEFYVVSVSNPVDVIGRYTGMPRTLGVTLSYRHF